MGSSRYKVACHDNLGMYLTRRDSFLFVHEHHTSGVTTVYDEDGNEVYQWCEDSGNTPDTLVKIIKNQLTDDEKLSWDGTFPNESL